MPDNQKEIYFTVTPLGAELAETHRLFHKEQDRKTMKLLAGFDTMSLEIVADFMEKMFSMRSR